MRIIQVFNRYLERGGEEMSVERVAVALRHEHTVFHCYFDSEDLLKHGKSVPALIGQALTMVYNPSAVRRFKRQLLACRPDLILMHNVFPVGSIGIYQAALDSGIPVLHYIHNFRPFSVNGYLWGDNRLLLGGLRRNFWPEILAGSWQGSRLRTAWYAAVILLMHGLGIYRRMAGWIAISTFMKQTFAEAGIPEEKIFLLPHSWEFDQTGEADAAVVEAAEPSILFLGRLTEAKGLRVLLDAWQKVEAERPVGRLIIGGDGPMAEWVVEQQAHMRRVDFPGFVKGARKSRLLRRCRALVVPSVWWEPLGLVVYEAYQYGRPVIAARSGGLTENVEDGETGWLYEAADVDALKDCLLAALDDCAEADRRGAAGRTWVETHTCGTEWLERFDAIAEQITREWVPPQRSRDRLAGDSRSVIPSGSRPIRITAYLADQNPGHDRSFGISRMSQVVLDALQAGGRVDIATISSRTSQQAPANVAAARVLPWGTRGKWVRLLTDHLHPLLGGHGEPADLYYFPKGYLPMFTSRCQPSVVTIHDTIIQYDNDHYPHWRTRWEYRYWALMLKHTLRTTDLILTVSESSKRQIYDFMDRHGIARKEITVTYEPCQYENIEQPVAEAKDDCVIHLASCEPHKRTAHLIRWWHEAESQGMALPKLHLIGSVPREVMPLVAGSRTMVKLPFLAESALQAAYRSARALILPSEIEGFGLPALEAYYLGTPACFVRGTSVEEILGVTTVKGGFSLESAESLFAALDEVTKMSAAEIRECGLKLRQVYAAEKVARNIVAGFRRVIER